MLIPYFIQGVKYIAATILEFVAISSAGGAVPPADPSHDVQGGSTT